MRATGFLRLGRGYASLCDVGHSSPQSIQQSPMLTQGMSIVVGSWQGTSQHFQRRAVELLKSLYQACTAPI